MAYDPKKEYEFYVETPTRCATPAASEELVRLALESDERLNRAIMPVFAETTVQGEATLAACLRARTPEQQFRLDCALWYGALTQDASQARRSFLKRIFTVLYKGGLLYKGDDGWQAWSGSDLPLASALSHGGRVLIQLPRAENEADADDFIDWLGGGRGDESVIFSNRRMAATHGIDRMDFREMTALSNSRFHRVHEGKKDHGKRHYGVNICLGGEGNLHPVSHQRIDSSGEFGHVYVYYLRPTTTQYGGLLVGCEGSAPIDAWEKGWGYKLVGHRLGIPSVVLPALLAILKDKILKDPTNWVPDPSGGYHKMGSRQEFGAGCGHKWDKLGVGPSRVYNAMIVDLTDTGWRFLEQAQAFQPQRLGTSGAPPRPVSRPVMPRILCKTCLTRLNLALMRETLKSQDVELVRYVQGKVVPQKLDIDEKKRLGHYRPKTRQEITPRLMTMGRNVQPTAAEPLQLPEWTSLSSAFGPRNKIKDVDSKLRAALGRTHDDIVLNVLKESRGDRPGFNDPDLIRRGRALQDLLGSAEGYLSARGLRGSRGHAVRALEVLVLRELELLDAARQMLH